MKANGQIGRKLTKQIISGLALVVQSLCFPSILFHGTSYIHGLHVSAVYTLLPEESAAESEGNLIKVTHRRITETCQGLGSGSYK